VDFAFSLIYLAILFALSPILTLVTLATLPLIAAVGLVTNPLVRSQIKRTMAQAVRASSFLTESITGIQTIKSQNAELKTRWEFQSRYSAFIGEDFKLKITRESIANLSTFLSNLSQLVVAAVAIWLIIQGDLNIGAFIAFRILSGYIQQPLVQLVSTWQDFQFNTQALRMVADVVDRDTEQTTEQASNIPLPPLQGRVQFVDVAFRFRDQGPLVLDGVNLEIPLGSFVGLVGSSGSGKSTLLKLLPRFYPPVRGSVLIDGLDISKVELYSLRRQIGVVPQDSLLFDGTIRENLLMVKPDATAAEMIRAARIACAHDFIMQMPQGYNSSVGERGAGLSGGQRQRLALARAFYRQASLLVLDEATSALDAPTESLVMEALELVARRCTTVVIAHRLSTVRRCDRIFEFDRGRIRASGTYEELLARSASFAALVRGESAENSF
jgi:ATP-binding cassette subfamily B protein